MAGPGVGWRILAPGAAGGAGSDDDIAAGRRSPGGAVGSAPTRTHAAGGGGPARRRSRAGKAGVRGLAARPDDAGTDGAADARHRSTALTLHVGGAWARDVGLPAWFVGELPPTTAPADAPFLHDADGQVLGESDLQMLLLCAAVDAGLPDSGALTPERLRHTAMAWLVREGLRFADLPRRFGRVDARALADLAALVADVPRRHADEIDPLMPALRVSPPS